MLDDHAVQQGADGVEAAHVQTCGGETSADMLERSVRVGGVRDLAG